MKNAGTVVWNGPAGIFEYDQFAQGTKTLAAIAKFGVGERISYMSTGGGAFLEFLEGKKLPAIEVLEQRASGLLPE